MTTAAEFPDWVALPTVGLVLLGAGCVPIASMISFSVLQTRPIGHEILIPVFVTLTTPVTLVLLVRAALHRSERTPRSP